MRVRFEWFEPTFDPLSNFFVDALKLHYGDVQVITDKLAKCELEIVSVFSCNNFFHSTNDLKLKVVM